MRKRIILTFMAAFVVASAAWAESLSSLQRRANNGDAEAQYKLGESYAYTRNGASYDKATAIKWFNMALDQGYKEALFDLGLMYRHDAATKSRAIECFELYIDYYYSEHNTVQSTAKNCLSELGVTNYVPGTRSRQGASGGGRSAAEGCVYNSNGWLSYCGPVKDFSSYPTPSESLSQLKREAEGGNPRAQYRLGEYYGYGYKNTPTDNNEAVRWFTKALEQGYEDSYFDLGLMYRSLGDKARAIYYFKLDCDHAALVDGVAETSMNCLKDLGVSNYKVGSTRGSGTSAVKQPARDNKRQNNSTTPSQQTAPAKPVFMLTPGFYNFSKILYFDESGNVADYVELTGSVEVTKSYIRVCTDDGDINCKSEILSLQSPAIADGVHTLIDKRGHELKAWTDSEGKRNFGFESNGSRIAVVLD